MKKTTIIISVIFSVLGVFTAFAEEKVNIMSHEDSEGNATCWITTTTTLAKCPTWDLSEDPPVSAAEAVQTSKTWLSRKYKSFNMNDVYSISMYKLPQKDLNKHWYYVVCISGNANVDGVEAKKEFYAIVLMNGKIVAPLINPANQNLELTRYDAQN